MAYNKREYKLVNTDNGKEVVLNGTSTNNEIRNYLDSDYTIKRSTKNFSLTKQISKSIEFTGSGAAFLRAAYDSKGTEANVKFYEYRFNPETDVPYIYIIADFDFNNYKRTKTTVEIPFTTGGLSALISSKQSTKYELNRTESIDGVDIGELNINEFAGVSRPLDLTTLLETSDNEQSSNDFRMRYGENYRYGFYSLPFDATYDSDDTIAGVPNGLFNVIAASEVNGSMYFQELNNNRSQLFLYDADVDKNLDIDIKLNFRADFIRNDNLDDNYACVALVKFQGGDDPIFQMPVLPLNDYAHENFIIIKDLTSLAQGQSQFVDVEYSLNIDVSAGESLGLFVFGGGYFETFLGAATLDFNIEAMENSIFIQEFSQRDDINRRSQFVLNNDTGKRLLAIINSNEQTYKSEHFESSEFKYTGVTSGKYLRGFTDESITLSLKDWLENSYALYGMSYNIEYINGKETLVHEPLKHFMRSEVVIKIPEQVNNVSRSVANDFIFSSVTSGYKKPSGDNLYEEVNGLNEYNTVNEYVTPITKTENDYDIQSPFRADSEGKELTYRRNIVDFPTEDYRTDNTIFNLDLKDIGTGVYTERVWQDDYEEAPQNIFSPDTATGLRLTPWRNMQRHFWFLKSSFYRLTDKYIRYASSIGNSSLITKKDNEEERSENGDIQVSSIENSIFVSEWIEFEYPLNYDLINKVNGFTDVDGRKIPNMYFKIEFINEFKEKEYGYLFELQPQKEGKWKLLKAL